MIAEAQKKTGIAQAGKFLFSGLVTNVSVYVAYLLITVAGMGHKTAMSLLFVAGMMLSYNMNKRWTFTSHGARDATLWRFVAAYAAAYLLNFFSMWWAVDRMGIAHYLVQAVNIVVISALLFVAQKYWIFAAGPVADGGLGSCDSTGR